MWLYMVYMATITDYSFFGHLAIIKVFSVYM